MSCEHCEFRDDCRIRKMYLKANEYYKNGDLDSLKEISNNLELHESYMVEMRKNVNSKVLELLRKRKVAKT